jgi:hypothetical protein
MSITSDELRLRVLALDMPQTEVAYHLGLSLNGLVKQMRGERRVSKQTELLVAYFDAFGPIQTGGGKGRLMSRFVREQLAQRAAATEPDHKPPGRRRPASRRSKA